MEGRQQILCQHSACVLFSSYCVEQLYKKSSCWSQSREITWCDLKELKPTAHSSHSLILCMYVNGLPPTRSRKDGLMHVTWRNHYQRGPGWLVDLFFETTNQMWGDNLCLVTCIKQTSLVSLSIYFARNTKQVVGEPIYKSRVESGVIIKVRLFGFYSISAIPLETFCCYFIIAFVVSWWLSLFIRVVLLKSGNGTNRCALCRKLLWMDLVSCPKLILLEITFANFLFNARRLSYYVLAYPLISVQSWCIFTSLSLYKVRYFDAIVVSKALAKTRPCQLDFMFLGQKLANTGPVGRQNKNIIFFKFGIETHH